MKKLLSFVIVALMIVSSVVPVFALSSEPADTGAENHLSIWVEDTELDPDETTTVSVFTDVSHNTDGFEYLKFFLFYPECLSLTRMSATGILEKSDITAGIESMENTKNLADAFDTLGLDPADYLDGHTKYTSVLIDAERYDDETDDPMDCFDNGRIVEFKFTYDPALNPSGDDIEIRMFNSPDDQQHIDLPGYKWDGTLIDVSVFGGVIKLKNSGSDPPTPPPPSYTDPTIEISSETINEGDTTATFNVTMYNNPGTWSLQTFVIYDKTMKYAGFARGEVIPASAMSIHPGQDTDDGKALRDKDVDTALAQPVFVGLDEAFTAQGANYAGKLMTIGQFENNEFVDITGDGVIYSMTLDTSALTAGVYDIFLTYNPDSAINSDGDDLEFDVVHGTLTVVGEYVCPHSETENVNIVPADCTNPGSHDVKCKLCGDIIETGVVDQPLGHDYIEEVIEPTCTTGGYTKHTCSRCGDNYTDNEKTELGHDPAPAVEENRVDPECEVDGSVDHVVYCNRCGIELSRTPETLTHPGHDWVEKEVTGNCGEIGTIHYECSRCGDTKTEAGTLIEHDYVVKEKVDPTCTTPGYTKYECSRCGDKKQDDFGQLGHDPLEAVEENRVEPKCEVDGSVDKVVYCNRCGLELTRTTEVLPKLGHDYEDVVTPPSCTAGGYTTHTCSRCGDTYTDNEKPALGHEIPVTGVEENRVEPTCTTDGSSDEVKYCGRCGAELSRDTYPIPALGHDWDDGVDTAATCTTDGGKLFTCKRCGDTKLENPIPALGHDWDDGVKTDPTCETEGGNLFTCKRCGATELRDKVPALGHDWDGGKVTKLPTETEEGEKTYTCKRDPSHTKTEAIPKLEPKGTDDNKTTPTTPDNSANNGGAKQTGDSITTLIFISMFALISGTAVVVAKKKLFDK